MTEAHRVVVIKDPAPFSIERLLKMGRKQKVSGMWMTSTDAVVSSWRLQILNDRQNGTIAKEVTEKLIPGKEEENRMVRRLASVPTALMCRNVTSC